jgi:hypothetical protein
LWFIKLPSPWGLARDPAAHARLDAPRAVADLLQALGKAGARDAVTVLLARDPAAGHVRLDDPGAVATLLEVLRGDAVTVLLARDPAAHARLDDPAAIADLLEELDMAGASEIEGLDLTLSFLRDKRAQTQRFTRRAHVGIPAFRKTHI